VNKYEHDLGELGECLVATGRTGCHLFLRPCRQCEKRGNVVSSTCQASFGSSAFIIFDTYAALTK
jgi:hypothetical protein